jgi:aspartate carbamoyltransferase catalytic subunit
MERSDRIVRHLLDIDALSDRDIESLIGRTLELAAGAQADACNATTANLFFEPSTRTRVSFELAASRLGMRVVNIELDRSSASKGECLEDTLATLAAMGVDCLVVRHPETGRLHRLADQLRVPLRLLNAGDGQGEHPSQALLDAATLAAADINWSRATIAIVGDIRHSRVARSNLKLFDRLGVGCLRIAGPAELLPEKPDIERIEVCDTLEAAVRDADVVMMLRVQRERMDRAGWPDPDQYHRRWGLIAAHLELARPGCRVMHPGPINRGMEIDDVVADGPRSLILAQVRMGVFARMAIFEWLHK